MGTSGTGSRRTQGFAAVASALLLAAATAGSQEPLHVLDHMPRDVARPTDVITITFDRPVAGTPDHIVDPSRIVKLSPELRVRAEWRDPSTVRLVPLEPLTPGDRYDITVDTAFTAIDGSRLAAPERFAMVVRGPALIGSVPRLSTLFQGGLDPTGRLMLGFSAPVPDSLLMGAVRLIPRVDHPCGLVHPIDYRVVQQRSPQKGDSYELGYRPWERDTSSMRFMRIVELVPNEPIPEDCIADLSVPSLDSLDSRTVRYQVRTPRAFGRIGIGCGDDCPMATAVGINFDAPVAPELLMASVHFEPAAAFNPALAPRPVSSWRVSATLAPHSTYRVTVDSSLRDIYGRQLSFGFDTTFTTGDRAPDFGYATALVLVRGNPVPFIRVRHLNVDSIALFLMRVPESERVREVTNSVVWEDDARRLPRDPAMKIVALHAPLNEERTTDIPLPELGDSLFGRLIEIHARLYTPTRRPDSAVPRPPPKSALTPAAIFAGRPRTPRTYLEYTDLLAHARLSSTGGIVWVTSARSGLPVAGARVALLDTSGFSVAYASTDDRGLARLTLPPDTTRLRVLEVTLGRDRSLTDISRQIGPGADFQDLLTALGAYQLRSGELTHAAVFTDRDIYRPGERVEAAVAVRDGPLGSLVAPPAGDSARLQLSHWTNEGKDESVRDTVVHLSRFGMAAAGFQLAAGTTLDSYTLVASLVRNGTWHTFGSATLRVAEYRAPEFVITAKTDSAPHIRGDTIVASVTARYLFGAPMGRATVDWYARYEELYRANTTIPGIGSDWTVGDGGAWWLANDRKFVPPVHRVDTLDAAGTGHFRIPTDSVGGTGSLVQIDAAVTDLNRQVVATTTSTVVNPAAFYIAIRDSASPPWWTLGQTRRLQFMAVRRDGSRVTGVAVQVATMRYQWKPNVTNDPNDFSGAWHADTLRLDTLVTGESNTTLELPRLKEGPLQVVATALDDRQRTVRSTLARYVYGGAPIASRSPLELPVHLQNNHLKAGDNAAVSFTSPWQSADAWITVEREGVMRQQLFRNIHGSVTDTLAVSARDVPDVFVSVLLLRRDSLAAMDSPAERVRVGYAVVHVDDASKRLAVTLRPLHHEYAPGESATVEVSVRDARRRPVRAEATIWGVDEGVLSLTNFAAPDPMHLLYAPVGDGVVLSSTLRSLASGVPEWLWRHGVGIGFGYGAGVNRLSQVVVTGPGQGYVVKSEAAATGGSTTRTDFRTTAFFKAGIRTDSNGVARITVKLPDNLTTFRLMTVVVGAGDEYGSAQSSLLATKPLLLRAALPRFIRAGDSVYAGAVVNTRGGTARTVDVTASGRSVTLIGDAHVRAALDASGTEVRFPWRGIAGDSAHFRLRATDGTHSDDVEVGIPVRPDQTSRAHTLTGMVTDSVTVRFNLPKNIDAARSRLTIRTGTSPIPTLRVARDYLLSGTYSCTDQLTSAGRMLISLLQLERTGIKVLGDTIWARDELQRIADELARRHREPWAFECWDILWPGSAVAAAANLLLLDMRDVGVDVDPVMVRDLSKAFAYILDSMPLFPDTSYGRRADRALKVEGHLQGRLGAIAFLHRTGEPRESDLQRLRENAARLTWEDRVWLAELLEQSGHHAQARELLDRLWGAVGQAGNRVEVPDSLLESVGFPSNIRPIARLLSATLAIEPSHPRLGALVERLTTRTRAEHDQWWNTQDHVAATVALASFVRTHRGITGRLAVQLKAAAPGAGMPAFTLSSTADAPRDTSISLAGLVSAGGDSAEVTLQLKTTGSAQYYAITVAEMTVDRPTAPAISGLTVERWYERFDDGRTVTSVREGDLVRVRMRVTAPAGREFVAVEDALPAGLEAVDLTLRTSAALGPFSSAASESIARRRDAEAGATPNDELYGSWYGGWWSPWAHPDRHDDRTVFFARTLWRGSFTVSYIARATTAGRFVRPQAHAEEVYNPAVNGRSEGGWFDVLPAEANRKP